MKFYVLKRILWTTNIVIGGNKINIMDHPTAPAPHLDYHQNDVEQVQFHKEFIYPILTIKMIPLRTQLMTCCCSALRGSLDVDEDEEEEDALLKDDTDPVSEQILPVSEKSPLLLSKLHSALFRLNGFRGVSESSTGFGFWDPNALTSAFVKGLISSKPEPTKPFASR